MEYSISFPRKKIMGVPHRIEILLKYVEYNYCGKFNLWCDVHEY